MDHVSRDLSTNTSLDRPTPSKVLTELRNRRREEEAGLEPGQRMELAFTLSLEVRQWFCAGLRAQGFAESEIDALIRMRRP